MVLSGLEGLAYLLTAAAALVVAFVVRRAGLGSATRDSLVVYFVATALWSAADLAALIGGGTAPGSTIGWVVVAAAIVVAAVSGLSLAITDVAWRPTRRTYALLSLHPTLMALAAVADPWTHLLLVSSGAGSRFGIAFWLHTAVSYVLLTLAFGRVVRRRTTTPVLRSRSFTLFIVSGVPPLVGNLLTVFVLGPDGPDTTPSLFLIGALVLIAALRHGLSRLIPVARSTVFDTLVDAVVVLDSDDRVADVNKAALGLIDRSPSTGDKVVGRTVPEVSQALADLVQAGSGEHRVTLAGRELMIDLRQAELHGRRGRLIGRLLVLRDVTAAALDRSRLADANDELGRQVALSERLRAELADQVLLDPGTGLRNRRYLASRLPWLVEHAESLSLVMLDIDHFKRINDTFGHATGDAVLVATARAIDDVARARDGEAVRYGGEEFVVLLAGRPTASAAEVSEELRDACSGLRIPARTGSVQVTVSAGVASWSPVLVDSDGLLGAADDALYQAKRSGRDRTVVAEC